MKGRAAESSSGWQLAGGYSVPPVIECAVHRRTQGRFTISHNSSPWLAFAGTAWHCPAPTRLPPATTPPLPGGRHRRQAGLPCSPCWHQPGCPVLHHLGGCAALQDWRAAGRCLQGRHPQAASLWWARGLVGWSGRQGLASSAQRCAAWLLRSRGCPNCTSFSMALTSPLLRSAPALLRCCCVLHHHDHPGRVLP